MLMDVMYILVVIGVILFSMTLHEALHGYMAYWLGDDTAKHSGRLTLNPIKHIDPFMTILLPLILAMSGAPIFGGAKPVPFNPARLKYDEWGAALVALAGPLTNFILAFVGFGALAMFNPPEASVASTVLSVFVLVNLGFFVFNMIPVPPLDGSRVLYALAPDFARKGMEAIERFGILFIFAIVLMGGPIISQIMGAATDAIIKLFSNIFGIPV
jgi:Zn-dependent protease